MSLHNAETTSDDAVDALEALGMMQRQLKKATEALAEANKKRVKMESEAMSLSEALTEANGTPSMHPHAHTPACTLNPYPCPASLEPLSVVHFQPLS